MHYSTAKSWKVFKQSTKYLAMGSSTHSKVPALVNSEPALIVKGKGCRVWDLDGNEYIDFRCGLGPVSLGYAVPEINNAITAQLKNGIVFGHPHPLEGEVAKLLVKVVPCAERVRFLKTGGEAVAACIKIARNATKRNKILQCGYNGWLNSLGLVDNGGYRPKGLALSQPSKGVPLSLQTLHKNLPWGDIEPWQKMFSKEWRDVAAIVIASNYIDIEKGKDFLPALRKLTKKYGSLMIMDEIVTGFRVAIGGAHEYFNFQPDLAVFAKGFANGMPISAYLGRADLLDSVSELGISSTFGGETLSLAAAKAVITFYQKKKVINHLWKTGKLMCDGVRKIFKKYEIPAQLQGCPPISIFSFKDAHIKNNFFKNCYVNGVSLYDGLYVNYSHKENDIKEALRRIENAVKRE